MHVLQPRGLATGELSGDMSVGLSGVYLWVCNGSKVDAVFATWGLCSSAPVKTHVFSSRSGLHDSAQCNYNHTPFLSLLMKILNDRISGVPVSVGTCYVSPASPTHPPLPTPIVLARAVLADETAFKLCILSLETRLPKSRSSEGATKGRQ